MEFVSLQGANTASLTFDHVKLDPNWVLSKEGTDYIAKTRPNFLGFQFGLAFGLAKRSLDEVEASLNSNRSVLREEFETTRNKSSLLSKTNSLRVLMMPIISLTNHVNFSNCVSILSTS